jgi:hypothetical protein
VSNKIDFSADEEEEEEYVWSIKNIKK